RLGSTRQRAVFDTSSVGAVHSMRESDQGAAIRARPESNYGAMTPVQATGALSLWAGRAARPPRSGLSRSDLVLWHFCGKARRHSRHNNQIFAVIEPGASLEPLVS